MSFVTKSLSVLLEHIEQELLDCLQASDLASYDGLHEMLSYAMGWGDSGKREGQGKRIRPVMVLLCAQAAGGEWQKALPFAAAVEYIHNFSLIHDDIEDNSPVRRGRPSVWIKYGIAQAINAGDAMFALAHLALLKSEQLLPLPLVYQGTKVFDEALIHLTGGQYLDIWFEDRQDVLIDEYLKMISGKTAALLGCAAQLGSISAGSDPQQQEQYKKLGHSLGLAFQIQDDYLGIWGNAELIGKSTESDLLSGKKSLPILYGLETSPVFAERWKRGGIRPNEVVELAGLLTRTGAQTYTKDMAEKYSLEAFEQINALHAAAEPAKSLMELVQTLLKRDY